MATRVTNYFTANGEIIAERTAGFPGHDYIPDGLGNVSATASPTTQGLQYFARYLPYGRAYSVQTTNTLPAFRWVGARGYRATGRLHAENHARRRHLSNIDQRWTSSDALWPWQRAYGYAGCHPVNLIDRSGLAPVAPVDVPVASVHTPMVQSPTICGNTLWEIIWQYIPPWPAWCNAANGAIIQHVEAFVFVYDCNGGLIFFDEANYYEAWLVWGRQTFPTKQGDWPPKGLGSDWDHFWYHYGDGSCTFGEIQFTATVGYYENDEGQGSPYNPWNEPPWQTSTASEWPGGLQWINSPNVSWIAPHSQRHNYLYQWFCCGPSPWVATYQFTIDRGSPPSGNNLAKPFVEQAGLCC